VGWLAEARGAAVPRAAVAAALPAVLARRDLARWPVVSMLGCWGIGWR